MDFGIIYQLKTKKFWWLDTIFYAIVTLLLATIICFVMFSVKISIEEKKISELENKIAGTGTAEQKDLEKQVFAYQQKIDNFATLLANHKIPTNIFKTLERDTLPNVWIADFSTDSSQSQLSVSGETENLNVLSRQVDILERNELVKNISNLSSSLQETGRIRFDLKIDLDPRIFFPIEEFTLPSVPVIDTTSPSTSLFLNSFIF